MFSIQELEIFRAVARSGGIVRAAAQLHRVPSNVATRLKQLEARLARPLFHREKRRLVLSAEGKVLLDYADRLLGLAQEAHSALQGGAPGGAFRLGALESTAAARLPPLLARYHRDHPGVRLELSTGTTGALVERVLAGELDAAFVAEPFTADGLEMRHAFTEALAMIAPAGFRLDRERHTPVLAFAAGCSYRRRLEAWLAREGIAPERVMEYASYHAIVACVAAGAGIALVPRAVLALRMPGPLEITPLPRGLAEARTQLVWRSGYRLAALDALRELLLKPSRPGSPSRSGAGSRAYRTSSRPPRAARPSRRS